MGLGDGFFARGMNLLEQTGNKISNIKGDLLEYVPEIDFSFIETKLINIGYKVPKIEVKISIPPAISMEIDLADSVINQIEKEKTMKDINFENEKETETNKVLLKILQGLDYAAKVNNKITFKNKKLSRVLVEGSLIPSVKLIYLDSDIASKSYLRDVNE